MVQKINHEQLQNKINLNSNLKVVNVLPQESFEKKHITNSMNIPLYDIPKEAPKRLDRNEEVVVYCADQACQASPKAAKKLEEISFTKVYDFEGGVDEWEKAGYPMVESTPNTK